MFKRIIIFAIIFVLVFTISEAYEINYRNNGVDIVFSSLDYQQQKFNNGRSAFSLPNTQGAIPNSNSVYQIPEIRLLLIIPNNAHLSYRINSKDEKIINAKLAFNPDGLMKDINIQSDIELKQIGKQRGIDMAMLRIQPITYIENRTSIKAINTLSISIDYGTVLGNNEAIIDNNEWKQFANVANPGHIANILNDGRHFSKSLMVDRQLSSDWYNPNENYIKLTTRKDGIAFVKMSVLLKILPELKDANPEYLHLYYDGKEYPITYQNDNVQTISNEDIFYFMGRRADGDTTWFANYTSKAAFFLNYNEATKGIRFKVFPTVTNTNETVSAVQLYKHKEEEKIYHRGFPQEPSATQPGEGWFKNILSPSFSRSDEFRDTLFILPDDNAQELNLSFQFASSLWSPDYEDLVAHILRTNFNNKKVQQDSFMVRARDSVVLKLSRNDFLPGYNTLSIKTLPVYNSEGKLIAANHIGADYYTYSLKSKPFALNGVAEFYINKLDKNSLLSVPGFSKHDIYAIDTIKGFLQKVESESGYFVSVSASNAMSLVSLHLNNKKVFYGTKKGLYIAYISLPQKIISKYFETANKEAADYLKSIPNNSFFVMALNANEKPVSEYADFVKQLGSNDIAKYQAGQQWVAYGIIKQSISEEYSAGTSAHLDGFEKSSSGDNYQASLRLASAYESNIIFNDFGAIEQAEAEPVNKTNLISSNNQADMFVLTHKKFLNSARKYAEYRHKTNPDISIMVLDVDDVHKEFTYGRKTPHAYKKLFKYAMANWQEPKLKYVLLWGDASWDTRKIQKSSVNEDYVSTYGWPASDYWYALLDDDDYLPDIQISRLPINKDEDGLNYLDKLVLNDSIDNNPWMKEFLILTGGQTKKEVERFAAFGQNNFIQDNIINSDLCATASQISKDNAGNTSQSQGGEIQRRINDGVEWVFFAGHGATSVFDLDGWQASKLNNKGKYGYLATLACNTTAFAEPNLTTRIEEYILEKDKAFIGTGGSAGVSWEIVSITFGTLMLQSLNIEKNTAETYLDAVWYAKSRMTHSIIEKLTASHFIYFGDPLLRLKFHKEPDFYFVKNDIKINNTRKTDLFIVNDTMLFSLRLYNLGHRYYADVPIRLYHTYKDKTDTLKTTLFGFCYPPLLRFQIPLKAQPGRHYFKFVIDPDNITGDINTKNNVFEFLRDVYNNAMLPLDPLPNWNVSYNGLKFRIINPLEKKGKYKYKFKLYETADTTIPPLYQSTDNEVLISRDYIEWKPDVTLEQYRNYWLGIITNKIDDNSFSPISLIPFNTMNANIEEHASFVLNRAAQFQYSGLISNLSLDEQNAKARVVLRNGEIPFRIHSVFGSVKSPNRDAEIRYNGIIYITVPPDILGFKLLAVSAENMEQYAVRNYNTYGSPEDAEKFVRFIKDTINDGDYLLLTTSGESIRAFKGLSYTNPLSIGSLDSLKYYLKNYYGSNVADTIQKDLRSYCMLARKNMQPELTRETVNPSGDTAKIDGNIIKYYKQGTYLTKPIGPAKKWNFIKVDVGTDKQSNIALKVLGYNVEKSTYDTLRNVALINGLNSITLSKINSDKYPNIKLYLYLQRNAEQANPLIKSLTVDFVPAPELLISSDNSSVEQDTILRGEALKLNLLIKNISLRAASPETKLQVNVESESKSIFKLSLDVKEIPANSEQNVIVKEITDNYDLSNSINTYLNPRKLPYELYDFNNSATFSQFLKEDTEKPNIVLKLDGRIVNDGDYVAKVPYIEVELYDNSPLIISDVKHIGIGINRPFPGDYDTVFTSYKRNVPLKAKLAFKSIPLEYGENYYRIIVFDAVGNSDTLTRKVFVALNGTIDDLSVQPNPFRENVLIKFDVKAPNSSGNVYFKVYNQLGQLVRELRQSATVGNNVFRWDGRDERGAIQPSGLYTFIIFVKSITYFEPVTGKMIFCR